MWFAYIHCWAMDIFSMGPPRDYISSPVVNQKTVVIITELKSVTRKRLMKTEGFCVSCGYSNIWRVWFSGTVIVGCGGDP
jgi:hypothetical protein